MSEGTHYRKKKLSEEDKIKNDRNKEVFKKAEAFRKLNKENISIDEMRRIVEDTITKITGKPCTLTNKTIKNYLDSFCDDSKNKFKKEEFKNSKNEFFISPKYHGLLIMLMSIGYFNDRLDERNPKNRFNMEEKIIKILDNVDILTEADLNFIKCHPVYTTCKTEQILMKKNSYLFKKIMNDLFYISTTTRYKYMKEFSDILTTFQNKILPEACFQMATSSLEKALRKNDEHSVEKNNDKSTVNNPAKFNIANDNDELPLLPSFINVIYDMLNKKRDNKEIPDTFSACYDRLSLIYESQLHNFSFSLLPDEINEDCSKDLAEIELQKEYKQIIDKLESVLDLNSPFEHLIFLHIKRTMLILSSINYVTDQDKIEADKLLSLCVKMDQQQLLNQEIHTFFNFTEDLDNLGVEYIESPKFSKDKL